MPGRGNSREGSLRESAGSRGVRQQKAGPGWILGASLGKRGELSVSADPGEGHWEIVPLGTPGNVGSLQGRKEGGRGRFLAWGRGDANSRLSRKLPVWPGGSLGFAPFPLPGVREPLQPQGRVRAELSARGSDAAAQETGSPHLRPPRAMWDREGRHPCALWHPRHRCPDSRSRRWEPGGGCAPRAARCCFSHEGAAAGAPGQRRCELSPSCCCC